MSDGKWSPSKNRIRSDATGLSPNRTYSGVCSRFYLIGELAVTQHSSSGGEDAGVLSAVSKRLIYVVLSFARLLYILMIF